MDINDNLNQLKEIWGSLGPIGPCVVLFLGGVILISGLIFNWNWLFPSHTHARNYYAGAPRMLVLVTGIILILCSVIFYVYRDVVHWQ